MLLIKGVVEEGSGLGSEVFVPTVNLRVGRVEIDYGVYACRVKVLDDWYGGVFHYGHRTTLDGKLTFEVHIFDFNKFIYGFEVLVQVLDKLREIIEFESVADLKSQILKDIIKAKKIIQN